MWLMTRLAIIFYVTILWITSLIIIFFTLHWIDLNTIASVLDIVYNDKNMRFIVAGMALAVICISIALENLIYGSRRRERTIAFENPSGPVTVSLSALEDLIRRLALHLPAIKEIRPSVLAVRKGLDIDLKLVLRAEANIPELTARLQDLVKHKVEEAIGMEGKLNIHVHVVKVSLQDMVQHKRQVNLEEPQVPFHGYRA